jgi:hypothetical protein
MSIRGGPGRDRHARRRVERPPLGRNDINMKSIHVIAALALPLAACGTTSTASTVASQPETIEIVVEDRGQDEAAQNDAESLDPVARLDAAQEIDARSLAMFQEFGLQATCIGAASTQDLVDVAAALSAQDRAALVTMCNPEDGRAFVMPRGTWLEVVASGTECVTFGQHDLDVELVTCEVIAAPEDRNVGQTITIPIGWIQGRIVAQ